MTRAHPALALAAVAVTTLVARPARAQHDHHHHGDEPGGADRYPTGEQRFELGLAVVGARFDHELYEGDYAGVGVTVGWHRGRLGARASLPAYHLRKNGDAVDGIGDASLAADLSIAGDGLVLAGLTVAVTLPTGDRLTGLGMGHTMLMPALWVSRDSARTSAGFSVGWCGAIDGDTEHHAHGSWPIVEPMSVMEMMGTVHGEVVVRGRVRAGARVLLAIPFADDPARLVAAVGGRWRGARAETGAELQAGLAGDPFTVRALVTSALRF